MTLFTVVVSVPGTMTTRTHFLLTTSRRSTFPLAINLKVNSTFDYYTQDFMFNVCSFDFSLSKSIKIPLK